MAGVGKTKLKGSSLIEVTVAAVIIVVVFLLASTLVANLWKSGPSDRRIVAHAFLNKLANQYSGEMNMETDSLQALPEGLELEHKSETYEGYPDLRKVTLSLKMPELDSVFEEVVFLYPLDEKN